MNTDLQAALTQALLSHEKVWADEEKTILAKNILLDLVEKTDPTIIGLLLGNDDLKRHFFVEVNGVLVFKLQDFRFFLDKHSVNNSYTKYANRIGLTDGNRFLKDSSDIVLDFPFKDCVLNGGQSTEEGEEIYFKRNNDQSDSQLYTKLTRKRQEIFFNQTLAFDEIDRLFDAKAFSKFSRYTADGKQAVGEIKRHSDGFLKGVPAENLIIKGNNLIALHSLAKQFKGKVKLIYIDPPYYSPLSDNEYVRRYHFVEGLARDWKGVEIQENTVTKKFKSYPTPFSTRKGAADAFDKLFKKFSDSILIVSYSSNSQPTQDEMVALMSKYKEHVEVVPIDYTYSFGNQKHAKTNRNKVQEYLFVGFNGEDVWQKQKLQLKK